MIELVDVFAVAFVGHDEDPELPMRLTSGIVLFLSFAITAAWLWLLFR